MTVLISQIESNLGHGAGCKKRFVCLREKNQGLNCLPLLLCVCVCVLLTFRNNVHTYIGDNVSSHKPNYHNMLNRQYGLCTVNSLNAHLTL